MNRMRFKVGGLILEGPPMWTCENRPKYNRDKLHYPSDLTDEEWSHVARPNMVDGSEKSMCARWSMGSCMR